MTLGDFKLYVINTTTLGITTFAEIEMSLKVLLLLVTIGYTVNKWIKLKNNKQCLNTLLTKSSIRLTYKVAGK